LDVSAQGFWGDRHECAFFDVRVFNPLRPAIVGLLSMQPTHVMRISKREAMSREIKKLNMAHSHSASGGMAPAATTTFKRLASLISNKQQQDYNKTITWIRCLLSFSLVRSSVMCLRGAQSSYHCPARPDCGGCGPLRRSHPNLLNYKLSIWTTFVIHFITLLHLVCTISILYIFFTHSHSNYTDISKKKSLDALGWGRLCTSLKATFLELCHSLAITVKRLCTELVDPASIALLMTSRRFALHKNLVSIPSELVIQPRHIIVKPS